MDDWLGLHDFIFYRTRELTSFLFDGTFLESSSTDIAFFLYVLLTCLTTFAGIMLSMFMILWIERKFYARVNDRRGATTALRSLWVGENGVTAGEWWNMIPFGLGKPVGAINGWLNKMACTWGMNAAAVIGVRDLVARGYFIPGRTSQKGGWSGACVPCRTLSDPVRGQA